MCFEYQRVLSEPPASAHCLHRDRRVSLAERCWDEVVAAVASAAFPARPRRPAMPLGALVRAEGAVDVLATIQAFHSRALTDGDVFGWTTLGKAAGKIGETLVALKVLAPAKPPRLADKARLELVKVRIAKEHWKLQLEHVDIDAAGVLYFSGTFRDEMTYGRGLSGKFEGRASQGSCEADFRQAFPLDGRPFYDHRRQEECYVPGRYAVVGDECEAALQQALQSLLTHAVGTSLLLPCQGSPTVQLAVPSDLSQLCRGARKAGRPRKIFWLHIVDSALGRQANACLCRGEHSGKLLLPVTKWGAVDLTNGELEDIDRGLDAAWSSTHRYRSCPDEFETLRFVSAHDRNLNLEHPF